MQFVNDYRKDDPETLSTLNRMKQATDLNNASVGMLKVELAVVSEYNKELMDACYNLEGDSPNIITFAYDTWNEIRHLLLQNGKFLYLIRHLLSSYILCPFSFILLLTHFSPVRDQADSRCINQIILCKRSRKGE